MSGGEPSLAVLGRLGRAQVEQTVRRAARRLGRDRGAPMGLDTIVVPDSSVAVEAASLLHTEAPAVLAAHSGNCCAASPFVVSDRGEE